MNGAQSPYYQSQPNLQASGYSQPNNYASQPNLSQQPTYAEPQKQQETFGGQNLQIPQHSYSPNVSQNQPVYAATTQEVVMNRDQLDKSPQWHCLFGALHIRYMAMILGCLATITSLILSLWLVYMIAHSFSRTISLVNIVCTEGPAIFRKRNITVAIPDIVNMYRAEVDQLRLKDYQVLTPSQLYEQIFNAISENRGLGFTESVFEKLLLDPAKSYLKNFMDKFERSMVSVIDDPCDNVTVVLETYIRKVCPFILCYLLVWAAVGVGLMLAAYFIMPLGMYPYALLRVLDVIVSLIHMIFFACLPLKLPVSPVFAVPLVIFFLFHMAIQGWILYLMYYCHGYLTTFANSDLNNNGNKPPRKFGFRMGLGLSPQPTQQPQQPHMMSTC